MKSPNYLIAVKFNWGIFAGDIMEDRNYKVYMHTNKINGKKYIGITMTEPKQRWGYGYGYYNQKRFYNSIKKYGWNNFEHLVLFENLTKEEAETIEVELIKKYNTTDGKFGYNIDFGGNCCISRAEHTKNKISKTMKEKKINTGNKNPMYGKHGLDNNGSKPVLCVELNKIYNSIAEASRELNIIFQNISKVCKKERYTAGGYHWHFLEDLSNDFIKTNIAIENYSADEKYGKKKVICIETKCVYKSIHEASEKTGANKTQISKCCRGLSYTSNKLHWAYYDEWSKSTNKKGYLRDKVHHAIRRIICVEKNIEYSSIKVASIYTNISKQSINNCLRGLSKTAGGYHWEYVDKDIN